MPQLQSLISFFIQSPYWHHAWLPADPSQAASDTLWLMDAQWASIKQPWSAALWASTPAQQPESTAKLPKYKCSLEHWKKQSQPGETAMPLPHGSFQPVEQDLNASSGTGCLLLLIWILTLYPKCQQCTTIEGMFSLLVLYYFLLVKLLFLFLIKWKGF